MMEVYKWIIVTYLMLVMIMTFILIGLLEAHTRDKKAWLYVLIQPFGFLIFMYYATLYYIDRKRSGMKHFVFVENTKLNGSKRRKKHGKTICVT